MKIINKLTKVYVIGSSIQSIDYGSFGEIK